MAAYPVSDLQYPPCYSRRFTSFAQQLVMHSTSAPANTQHLPCQLVVEHDVGDILAYIDLDGTTKSITFLAAGVTALRMAPVSIETTTTVVAVTAFWSQKGI